MDFRQVEMEFMNKFVLFSDWGIKGNVSTDLKDPAVELRLLVLCQTDDKYTDKNTCL